MKMLKKNSMNKKMTMATTVGHNSGIMSKRTLRLQYRSFSARELS